MKKYSVRTSEHSGSLDGQITFGHLGIGIQISVEFRISHHDDLLIFRWLRIAQQITSDD